MENGGENVMTTEISTFYMVTAATRKALMAKNDAIIFAAVKREPDNMGCWIDRNNPERECERNMTLSARWHG
jgi:hypothetical protein